MDHSRPMLQPDFLDDDLWTILDDHAPGARPAADMAKDEPSLWPPAPAEAPPSFLTTLPSAPTAGVGPLSLPIHPTGGSLSKPVFRHDGLLVVGSEASAADAAGTQHGLFVTNFRAPDSSFLALPQAVRDLQWVQSHAVALAVGKDIQLLRVGHEAADCQLQGARILECGRQPRVAPITMTHSDLIRELAVSPLEPRHVLSGGFDETVCMTDVEVGDVLLKFDARDVVSSLRWVPDGGHQHHVSWTTDGGAFSIADTRIKSAAGQLHLPSPSLLRFDVTGGLFSHEFTSAHHVVLAYEHGYLAFLDTRMLPRPSACHMLCKAPLATLGEVRRSLCSDFALFGYGGFVVADLSQTTTPEARCVVCVVSSGATPTLRREFAPVGMDQRKTSGDFAVDNVNLLAVSDSAGIVAIYDMQTLRSHDTFSL
ncbi:hypothetical protein ACHHYP_10039 [Achlya hypogyna]|uniref:Uncharacterized protein n=1 Tax=Achlya hypogyna TaxID=1202772 RepID=A0A1V9ZIG7_ACHHY|nr:hypothetical protein ACHHYP_10039 [Achlya hypogyna]